MVDPAGGVRGQLEAEGRVEVREDWTLRQTARPELQTVRLELEAGPE